MSNIDLELIANTSYAILLASYIMRDILWLRVLTVFSLSFEIPYFYFQADPLWDGIGWDFAFILINTYWIVRLVIDRRPVHFTEEQKRLWETAFHRLRPRHARELFKRAKYKSIAPNEIISTPRGRFDELALISVGRVGLYIDGKKVEELVPGNFVGSAAFLERDLDLPTMATVVAMEHTSLMTWNKHDLRTLIKDDNQFSTAVEATLSMEIVELLNRAWHREALGQQEATQT